MLSLRSRIGVRAISALTLSCERPMATRMVQKPSFINAVPPRMMALNNNTAFQSFQQQSLFSSSALALDRDGNWGSRRDDNWAPRRDYGQRFDNDRGGYRSKGGRDQNRDRNRKGKKGGSHGQSDFDAGRNTARNQGPEGNGLMGLENYERVKELDGVSLIQLAQEDAAANAQEGEAEAVKDASKADFSEVKTQLLADHKILSPTLVNSLIHNRKYLSLTQVQSHTMIPILRGDSVVVRAKTGTGKTAAFSVPSIQHVLDALEEGKKAETPEEKEKSQGVKAVIISPTRELAQQIADEISAITSFGNMRQILTVCCVGGVSKYNQIKHAFRGRKPADIIVATPGRLYDLLQEPEVAPFFKNVKIKVLDEADRLLDIGFSVQLEDIDNILNEISSNGNFQTLLFSATIDRRVKDFAKRELGKNGKLIDTVPKDEPEAHTLVDQSALLCESWEHIYPATYVEISNSLREMSEHNKEHTDKMQFKGIIFMPTVPAVDHYAQVLRTAYKLDESLPADAKPKVLTIHGQMTQAARQRAADVFRKGKEPTLLITTDVVARGMDFPGVSHVFQMGTPRDAASYVHRIGRTGRIGHSGKAFLIMTDFEKPYLRELGKKNIKISNIRQFENAEVEDSEEVDNQGVTVKDHVARLTKAVDFLDTTSEELVDIASGIVSSYGYMRKDFGVNGHEFLNANQGFGSKLFKVDSFRWPQRVVTTWGAAGNRRKNFWDSGRGSSNRNTSRFASRGGNSDGYRRDYNNRNSRNGGRRFDDSY